MIKGAIFDVDGTLLDSMTIWDSVGVDYIVERGHTPKENLKDNFKNMSMIQAGEYLKREYNIPLSAQEIVDQINAMTEDFYTSKVTLKKGVKELLEYLRLNGVKICAATATDRYLVEAALERCGIRKYFSEIFTCTDVGHGKDEPVIFRKATEFLGTDKNNTVVFEDALYAISTAKKDGFYVAAVYDRFEKDQERVKALSDFFFDEIEVSESFKSFVNAI